MAVAIVSIRSKELKIRGIMICKFPLIRWLNLALLDNSKPRASCDILIR